MGYGSDSMIYEYMHENLIPKKNYLFKQTSDFKKIYSFKYVWTSEGKTTLKYYCN